MRAWIGQRLIHLFGSAPCVSAPLSETVPFFSCIESALHRCCLPPVSATRNTCRHARDRPCSKAKALISLNSPTNPNPNPEILTLIANHLRSLFALLRPLAQASGSGCTLTRPTPPSSRSGGAGWWRSSSRRCAGPKRWTKEMDRNRSPTPPCTSISLVWSGPPLVHSWFTADSQLAGCRRAVGTAGSKAACCSYGRPRHTARTTP